MSKQAVNHHVSVAIIGNPRSNEFLVQLYDNTYPRLCFRGAANLIGGNYQPADTQRGIIADSSPRTLFDREITEEFSINEEDPDKGIEAHLVSIVGAGPGAQRQTKFAPIEDITRLRDSVLRAVPYGDFLNYVPELQGKKGFTSVVSVYNAELPLDLFELTRRHISEGRSVRNEGFAKIISADDLVSGKQSVAWHTGGILGEFLGKEIPNPLGINVERIKGLMPGDSWDQYRDRFDYAIKV